MPVIPKKPLVRAAKSKIWAFRKEVESLSEKKSLLLYYDYQQHFNFLTDEQTGKIIKAMLSYEINGVFPEFDEPIMQMTFSFIKSNLDRDMQKFLEKCEKNAENGKKGGRPKKQNEQTDTTDGQKEQTNTANAEYSQSQSLNDSDDTQKRKRHFSQTYGNM